MDITYEIGKVYDLTYLNIIVKEDGNQYLVATDGNYNYTIKPYEYQTEYDSIPRTLSCYVKKIGFSGKAFFEQSKEAVLKNVYYQFGEEHKFVIDEVHIDANTNKTFFVLSDEYGLTHRYYPKDGEESKKSGDSLTLVVKGIVPAQAGKNNARLDLCVKTAESKTPSAELVYSTAKPVYPKNVGKKNFGCEDAKKEFKSSIVYPAGDTVANIDKQLGIICRTIAGFMNANGGTLYIGVSDNGYICGIEGEYCHLNDGEEEDYTYKENDDQYMLKITNRVLKRLGMTAGTLMNMRIEEEEGKKYCVVDIKKALRPIWFDGNKLFVRIVTTNRLLKNDEITQFVLDRVSKNSFVKQKQDEAPVEDNSVDEQAQPAVTAAAPQPAAPTSVSVVVKKPKKIWRHITFYDNGEWSFQKDELQGADVVCNAEIPEDAKQKGLILILAYENGHVEATSLKEVLYGKNGLLPESRRRGQGLCLANGKVVSVFCVKKKDMLLLTSEVDGDKFVKALDVDTLGIHDKMGKGNEIVREDGATLVDAVRIPDDDGARISLKGSGIFIEKNQKYTKGGVRLASLAPNYQTLIGGFTASQIAS